MTAAFVLARNAVGGLVRGLALFVFSTAIVACEYPDEGNMPLRRAVAKVKYLPETEAWAASMHKAGAVVQYAVRLDQPRRGGGRCYWPVEVRAGDFLWRRFYVTPYGEMGSVPISGTGNRPRP